MITVLSRVSCALVLAALVDSSACRSDQTSTSAKSSDTPGAAASTPVATVGGTPGARDPSQFDRAGYATFIDDGRLWVFREGSKDLIQFKEHGEPAKVVVRPGGGPNRMTIKAVDADTIDGYMLSKPGFVTFVDDGRLWVFHEGSKDLAQFMEHGEPAKVVVRPGGGPNRMTVKAVDAETIDAYMGSTSGHASSAGQGTTAGAAQSATASPFDKPGYVTIVDDGRLWIFRDGSKDLAQFKEHGEPAKVVIRPGGGPNRMTVKSVDAETIDAYLAAN